MTEVDDSGRDSSALGFGDRKLTVLIRNEGLETGDAKLYQLMKDERYVDVTLKFDDGERISCHRCILAVSSNYFDCMFSNGMRESNEEVIEVVGVASSVMTTALEFIYTGKCSSTLDTFFDLLLVANMYELKDLELSLLLHLDDLHGERGDFADLVSKSDAGQKDLRRRDIVDFFVEVWVFCRRYPVIAGSLCADFSAKSAGSTPLKQYVLSCLKTGWCQGKLRTSENLLSLDLESFGDFLSDLTLTDQDPKCAFGVASAWLRQPSRIGEGSGSVDSALIAQLDSLLSELRLSSLNNVDIDAEWKEESVKAYRDRIVDHRDSTLRREFLILPDSREKETSGFICHDVSTGETYYLDSPEVQLQDQKLYGSPKLMASRVNDANETFLHCVSGVCSIKKNVSVDRMSRDSSVNLHKYSFTRNRWIQASQSMDNEGAWTKEELAPLEIQGFLVPTYSNFGIRAESFFSSGIADTRFPFIRLSHDFEKEPEPSSEEEMGAKPDLVAPPDLQSASRSSPSSSKTADEKPAKEDHPSKVIYTDKPHMNMAEVLSRDSNSTRHTNMWECRVPNFEVSGVGLYKRSNSALGVALFGNTYSKQGCSQKETKTLLNAVRTKPGFPDGVCDNPLSVVSHGGHIYVLPSAPFTGASKKKGKKMLRLPRVWVFNPSGGKSSKTKPWISLPTPSCPDLDYAALYFDAMKVKIGLVLVQKPSSASPFSEVYDNQARGAKGIKSKPEGRRKRDGRVVGRFLLKCQSVNFPTFNTKGRVSDLWESLAVTEETANFLSLGCRLPGEIRLTSAPLNASQLRPVRLARTAIGDGPDFDVEVLEKDENGNTIGGRGRNSGKMIQSWIQHKDSPFHDLHSTTVEHKLNVICNRDETYFDSLKSRRLEHPLMETAPRCPSHPTIKFKHQSSYSLESLAERDYSDDDYGVDDEYYGYPCDSDDDDFFYKYAAYGGFDCGGYGSDFDYY